MPTDIPKKNPDVYGLMAFSLVCLVSLSGYMVAEAKSITVTSLYIEGAPQSVVFISDPHLQDKNIGHISNAVDIINSLNASVVLIGGDFVNGENDNFTLQEVWSKIDAPVYAILGNHDYHSGINGINGQYKMLDVATETNRTVEGYDMSPLSADTDTSDLDFADSVAGVLEDNGVNVLRNEYVTLDINGTSLRVVGLDDGWAGMADPPYVPESDDFTIFMIHEPECRADWDANLILSGHTHGGQFTPPFVQILNENGIIELSGYFDSGTPLYITSGIGSSPLFGIELRYESQPEIVVINPSSPIEGSNVVYA
ncbi:putative MPP superfamily phosphohydrolase [Methanomicrobium sp. W14]|uniref:metallophosphoesterase n=1 Tax=Methanomicrobium sp. W14 TaxID=2817839 RepID=UPI001AE42EC9|nr:metallophosphoesterase [Methanomicrobium sp. W14]MBP2132141.1 putative MPP superfamily phosphohydrolase [Methanomicrobium sp. W14]